MTCSSLQNKPYLGIGLLNKLILAISIFMLVASYALEYVVGLAPCIICEVQRIILLPIIILSCFESGLILKFIRMLPVSLGLYLGIHHVSLLGKQAAVNTCLPGITTLISYQGFSYTWQKILKGSPACSKADWKLLGFSLPEITQYAYALLLFLVILEFIRKFCRNN